MSERLDRIEGILEAIAQRESTQQLQIDVLVETQLELQQGQRTQQQGQLELQQGSRELQQGQLELQQGFRELQQTLQSLAKSVQAHCDDSSRHN